MNTTTASDRAQALAEQFERVNADAIAAVEARDEAAGATTRTAEGWPLFFAARHIAEGHGAVMGLVATVAAGGEPPAVTGAMLDAINAESLARHGGTGRAEALALLREHGAATAAAIRRLSEEQLDRTATMELFGGNPITVQQLIEAVLIGHAQVHLASFRAA